MSQNKKYSKKPPQVCLAQGCDNIAAYKTISKSAYFIDCINKIYERANMELLEDFEKPDDYWQRWANKVS